jgi:AmmeMemoRadiSam system protein B
MKEWMPKLRRDIDIIPTFYDGKRALLVKDSLGLIKEPFLIHGEILSLLGLINGERTIRDIQLDLIRLKKGEFVSSQEVEKILSELDSTFILESETYLREKEKILVSYSLLSKRAAFHAGRSYPQEPGELRILLDSFFAQDEEAPFKEKETTALIAPHIDLNVGKKVYARAYKAIKEARPRRVLLLGTGHSLYDSLFSLTEKDFETPLGTLRTDKDWVRILRLAGKEIVAANDIAHRSEHSLEFQLIFLQYLFGSDFSCIPILCGPFQPYLQNVSRPRDIPGLERFLDALESCLKEQDSTLVIAGVDLSHVGPKFGHNQEAAFLKTEAKTHDMALLEAVCKGDVEEFWKKAKMVNNRYNVCGLSSLAMLLEIYPRRKGYLLDYEFWEEEATQSAVSFAAVALEK